MASFLPFSLGRDIGAGDIDFEADTFYLLLVTSSHTPSQSFDRRNDITNEVSGTGYTAGGREINVASYNRSGGVTSVTFDAVVWPAPVDGFTPAGGWIYKRRGGASSADELVQWIDMPTADAAAGGTYTVTPSGALTITVP